MKAFLKNKYLYAAILIIFLYGCIKPGDTPDIPAIKYKDFVTFGKDSAYFYFTFKDGDGDIGLDNGDTNAPFNSGSKYYDNLIMTYYYKETDGSFHKYFNPQPTVNDTQTFKYRIPNITPVGQNKILDGEIRVWIDWPYSFFGHKTIKFDAFIYDRALNKSNVINTSEITVPQ